MLACLSSLWQATKPTNLKAGHVGFQGGLLRSKSVRFLKWGKGANAVNSEAIIRAAKLRRLPTYLPAGGGRWEVGELRCSIRHVYGIDCRLQPLSLLGGLPARGVTV